MRAPHEHVACFAFESAIDELAYAIGVDPVALRLANDTATDPITGKPMSSRFLAQCLKRGAERFGWGRRTMTPGSMVADDGSQIGWGVAAGAYPNSITAAIARLRVTSDDRTTVNVGLHEMGQGARTAIAATVADVLDVPAERVTVEIGDTSGVPLHLTAGSWGTPTALPAVRQAALAMKEALKTRDRHQPYIETEGRHTAPGLPDSVYDQLARGGLVLSGPVFPDFVTFSYIAHFVEVRVEPRTRRVRLPRIVSVADCGRVISPRTARSQVIGGVVWGIGATLREASEVDPRYGGFLNADFAEYAIPVNADIGEIDVDFIDEPDPLLNAMGAKGVGEVSMVGVAGAIANAVYHATGRRIRHLPIRIEDLL
jgi:xanthine dehydrogenase YagR molybdenum-binding subunit